MPKAKTYTWRDPKTITRLVLAVLAIDFAWLLGGLFIELLWGSRTAFAGVPPGQWRAPQFIEWLHAIFALVTLLGAVPIAFWILRASRNAHVLKGRSLTNSPIFAALWWYVIPFMSLFKPLESMGEIWDVSAPDAQSRKHNRAALVVWWASLLIAGGLGYMARALPNASVLSILQSLTAMTQTIAFAYIVWRIAQMQTEKRTLSVFSDGEPSLGVLERVTG